LDRWFFKLSVLTNFWSDAERRRRWRRRGRGRWQIQWKRS
jgi:hypothetical protein